MQCIFFFFGVVGQTKALNIQDYYNCGLEDLDLKIVLHRSAARIISFCIPPPPFFSFFNKMKYTFEQKRMFLQTLGLLEIKE